MGYSQDFTRSFLAGASVARMAQERQERMIQLRAQAAQQAMQERQIAAQAQMLTERANLYRQQAEQEQAANASLKASQDLYNARIAAGGDPVKVQQEVDASLRYANPMAYEKLARSRAEEARAASYPAETARKMGHDLAMEEIASEKASASNPGEQELTVFQPIDKSTGAPAVDEQGDPIKMVRTSKGGATLLEAKSRKGALDTASKAQVETLQDEIKALIKRKNELSEDASDYRSKRFRLQSEIGTVQKKIDSLVGRKAKEIAGTMDAGGTDEEPRDVAPEPPASVPATGDRIMVIDNRPESKTKGKKFWIDMKDQERAVKQGFKLVE